MADGLEGLQVLELGGGVAAGMAGKVLADLGATVVKIEPPQGDPTRRRGPFPNSGPAAAAGGRGGAGASGTFLYLNAGKRSVVADLKTPAGRDVLQALTMRAQLLLHDLPPVRMLAQGQDYPALARRNPALVMLSLTPFGLDGPYRDYAGSDLTVFHGSGWGYICPGDSTPLDFPPGKPFGQHALIQTGLHGAVVALAACRAAARDGSGEHIDLSAQAATAFQLGRHTSRYPYSGVNDTRDAPMPYEPFSFYPCKDGYIFIVLPEQAQWERLVELMGHPDWAIDAKFGDRKGREKHGKELKARLSEWTAQQEMELLFHACQGQRVGVAPVLSYPQIERQDQLIAREFFVEQPLAGGESLRVPGAPYLLRKAWWRMRGPAPALGEANGGWEDLFRPDGGAPAPQDNRPPAPGDPPHQPPLPLAGVRVLDFTWLWTGPHCTLALALLGADVIKVESSRRPDLTRRTHIFPPELEPGLNRCGYFNQVGQAKRGIGVDLSKAEGVELVLRLAERCDVAISNFGTGVIEKLGLGADALLARNPAMTVAMISAFGQTGPHRSYMGYGPLVHAVGGLSAQTGYGDGLPRDIGTAYGDPNGGVFAAIAICAALWARERDGAGGQVIDVSMWEAMLATAFEGWVNHALGGEPFAPMGNRDPEWAPHNVYRCRGEDTWVAIAVTDENQWQALCGAVGRPGWAGDARWRDAAARKANEDALDAELAAWCAPRDAWEVTGRLQAAGVPAFPSLDNKSLLDDPQLNARGLFTDWPHPEVGRRKLVGAPWRFSRRANGHGWAAPQLGQHTDEVFTEVVGLSAEEVAAYREQGVLE